MLDHPVATREEWLAARKALLEEEKEFTRAPRRAERQAPRAALGQNRQALPVRGSGGRADARRPLRLPPPADRLALHVRARVGEAVQELLVLGRRLQRHRRLISPQRDTAFVAVSRAPLVKLEARKRKMGWTFPWVSSGDGDFNYDFAVSFRDEDLAAGTATYNYRRKAGVDDGPARDQRLREQATARLPYLFLLRARARPR